MLNMCVLFECFVIRPKNFFMISLKNDLSNDNFFLKSIYKNLDHQKSYLLRSLTIARIKREARQKLQEYYIEKNLHWKLNLQIHRRPDFMDFLKFINRRYLLDLLFCFIHRYSVV